MRRQSVLSSCDVKQVDVDAKTLYISIFRGYFCSIRCISAEESKRFMYCWADAFQEQAD